MGDSKNAKNPEDTRNVSNLMVCNYMCLLLKDDKYFFLTWAESGFVNKQNWQQQNRKRAREKYYIHIYIYITLA